MSEDDPHELVDCPNCSSLVSRSLLIEKDGEVYCSICGPSDFKEVSDEIPIDEDNQVLIGDMLGMFLSSVDDFVSEAAVELVLDRDAPLYGGRERLEQLILKTYVFGDTMGHNVRALIESYRPKPKYRVVKIIPPDHIDDMVLDEDTKIVGLTEQGLVVTVKGKVAPESEQP